MAQFVVSHSMRSISIPFSDSVRALDSDCETDEEPTTLVNTETSSNTLNAIASDESSNRENIQPSNNNSRLSPSRKRSRLDSNNQSLNHHSSTTITNKPSSSSSSRLTTAINTKAIPLSFNLFDCVQLNVGGINYLTTFSTLFSIQNTYFTARFSHKFADSLCYNSYTSTNTNTNTKTNGNNNHNNILKDQDKSTIETQVYFIDRDGTHFRYILNYLRDRTIHIDINTNNNNNNMNINNNTNIMINNSNNMTLLKELLSESNFYSLDEMSNEIRYKIEIYQQMERDQILMNDMELRENKIKQQKLNESNQYQAIYQQQQQQSMAMNNIESNHINNHHNNPLIRSHSQPFTGLLSTPLYQPPIHSFPGPQSQSSSVFQFSTNSIPLQHSLSMPINSINLVNNNNNTANTTSTTTNNNNTNRSFEFTIDADF